MLRYIYLLCLLINFEIVLCYNSISTSNKGRVHRSVARLRKRQGYGSEDSPLTNIDVVSFMQKPDEPEDFEPYSYENKQRRSKDEDYLTPDAAPRLRRRSHKLSGHTTQAQQRLNVARHPKRKCSFSIFPFFSHKNKSKPGPKHIKRKSHSFKFSKRKHSNHIDSDDSQENKIVNTHKDLQITVLTRIDTTTDKRLLTSERKMKMTRAKKCLPNIIHNSRQYFAKYRMKNNETEGTNRERVSNANVNYEGNKREDLIGEELGNEIGVKDLPAQQKEQQRVLEELENRLRESYHVLRNLFKK